jgi:hypothetical protein
MLVRLPKKISLFGQKILINTYNKNTLTNDYDYDEIYLLFINKLCRRLSNFPRCF